MTINENEVWGCRGWWSRPSNFSGMHFHSNPQVLIFTGSFILFYIISDVNNFTFRFFLL